LPNAYLCNDSEIADRAKITAVLCGDYGRKKKKNDTYIYERVETKVFPGLPNHQSMGSRRILCPILFLGRKGPPGIRSDPLACSAGSLYHRITAWSGLEGTSMGHL